jgi:Cupin superfamily protein
MKPAAEIAPVITAANEALRRIFPRKPFAIRHKLTGHPLLTLPRIAQLASELPRDRIEYNSGKVAISQDPDATPSVDLDPVEMVKSIETSGAWMVLKRVEKSPEYRALLEATLLSVARARGRKSMLDAGFEQVEGFVFESSPNSTTPFHLDSEDNFFVHVHGEKFFTIFDNSDRAIVSDDEIERSMTRHRNLRYDERFASRGTEFHLFAGDGCYVPYQWPHWVRTADSHSISLAITWKTREVRRLNDLHFFNSMLRGIGLPQQPPGVQPVRDALKLAFYRTVTTAIRPLRASLAMRRVLRRIALGKRANYYLKRAQPSNTPPFRGARSASPGSITTIGNMDSGPAPRGASRNDEVCLAVDALPGLKPEKDIFQSLPGDFS